MEKKESNPFGSQDQTPNKPMLPHWYTTRQDAAQAFSEMVHRRNPDFNKLFAGNSQPGVCLITGESKKYANQSAAPKNDRDGTSMSAASRSKRSTDGDQDDSNKDSPLSKKQKSNIISEDENPSGLAQNLGKVVSESEYESEYDSDTEFRQEYEELCKVRDTLKEENSVLTQRLAKLSEKCLELTNENDSLEEELVRMFGPESIADLLHMKPT
ncbi:light-inducible protein CPRF3 isoform X2 [Medicago truncatula]|uniref:light-inducible protein CPRF3 isoform X2 n=1 Tax=Medicago truncatula TaxID=3880 RepID=UPI000D2F2442|nr:light-inducible protein CPRF3-like isoform X2 [Medicago truncatula]